MLCTKEIMLKAAPPLESSPTLYFIAAFLSILVEKFMEQWHCRVWCHVRHIRAAFARLIPSDV